MAALAYLVCAVVWGTTWYAIRVCIGDGGFPTYAAAALRFTLASAILVAIYLLGFARPGPRTRRELAWLGVCGLCNGGSYALIYSAETRVSGGLTAMLFGVFPLAVAILAVATRTERVRASSIIGSMVSAAGIAVLFWDRMSVSADQAVAVAMVLGGVLLSAIYSVILKREAGGQHPLATTAAFLLPTAVVLWCASLGLDDAPIPSAPAAAPVAALLYLGIVGSVLVFAAYFFLLKRVSLMTVTTLVFIEPTIAVVVDSIWEDDVTLSARSYAGGAIVLAGVAIHALVGRARRKAALS